MSSGSLTLSSFSARKTVAARLAEVAKAREVVLVLLLLRLPQVHGSDSCRASMLTAVLPLLLLLMLNPRGFCQVSVSARLSRFPVLSRLSLPSLCTKFGSSQKCRCSRIPPQSTSE